MALIVRMFRSQPGWQAVVGHCLSSLAPGQRFTVVYASFEAPRAPYQTGSLEVHAPAAARLALAATAQSRRETAGMRAP